MEKKLSAALAGACMLFAASAPVLADPATVASSAATSAALKPGPADAQFKTIYTAEWKWRMSQKDEAGEDDDDSGVSSGLPHIDAATQQKRLAYWLGVMKRLDGVAPAQLSAPERINYQVYRAQ